MPINIDILRATPSSNIYKFYAAPTYTNRSNAKVFKNPYTVYFAPIKLVQTPSNTNLNELLSCISKEYNLPFNLQWGRDVEWCFKYHRRSFTLLKAQYKAEVMAYKTENRYYYKFAPQIFGLKFPDKKSMMYFLLKYGSFVQQIH